MTHGNISLPAAVVFDLDGVLLDTTDNMRYALDTVWSACGRTGPAPFAEFLTHMGAPLLRVLDAVGLPEEAAARYERASRERLDLVRPFPGVIDGLRRLRASSVPMAVATGKAHHRAVEVLGAFGLLEFFGAVVGSDQVAHPKPAPDSVLRALAELGHGTGPARVFVGDSVLDMRSGRAAGVRVIAAGWGQTARETLLAEGPDEFAARPEQLWAALGRAEDTTTARSVL